MQLCTALAGLEHALLAGDPRVDITAGITFDPRAVHPGALFVARDGRRLDGHRFLALAYRRGAVAALVERTDVELPAGPCVVRVADVRTAAARLASRYYGEPGRELWGIAVTGTNGKTSVAFMLEAVLGALGRRVGVIGTGGSRFEGRPLLVSTNMITTPQAPELQAMLRYLADGGAECFVLEASSMALLHRRVEHTFLDIGVFTNLTPDHLDDHLTLENYRQAKLRLFNGRCRQAVVNLDDPVSTDILALMPDTSVTCSASGRPADLRATDIGISAAGSDFTVHHEGTAHAFHLPVPGRFAVENALAATAAAVLSGHGIEEIAAVLAELPQIPGRFDTYRARSGATVVVDYAHSVDALEKVLTTIRGLATGRVITVFGCSGDRDPGKRAPMGEIAGRLSDLVVLTSTSPRGEDPELILDRVEAGLATTPTPYARIGDRREAIAEALSRARGGDVVLVAGRGSDPCQRFAGRSVPFLDKAVVQELDRAAGGRA
ncbi:UDP-N-acetylmuramoyl-L-alanyl-D-glutamate--2,6-diaminopimelate ligase [Saccharothrix sp. ST-888]|uniref:UDP-N-acetylmuramoyl-L-alanyl-D-glutamate--2, 6-diaminopimelate ligase n=1 Tax=Saccharothrix sp. ST-888 TaxID=1427391 RepID=UPI0005ED24F2|nr:UDP-N-acetylmuramoyl-L-alanyl-D-glutamate--2,6-diaminopimelate ligase [Saccharothrix sp. ST-888]KJK58667.1 UDP-N-acetylmuramyl peptide synthase [Saccharothrix sp. ST-888]